MPELKQPPELRFGFGENWQNFIEKHFSPERVSISHDLMLKFLNLKNLSGRYFLDIGCGSGIHSLAAFKAGAKTIVSFDYDVNSVKTTKRIREMHGSPENWEVLQGSILDATFLKTIAKADIVYSWGVLHHTGEMWNAIANAASLMKDDGVLLIALYDADAYRNPSPEFWLDIKKRYNHAGWLNKRFLELWYSWRYIIRPELKSKRNPIKLISGYKQSRGMDLYTDIKDWLGGWPMEFSTVPEVTEFLKKKGFVLANLSTGEGNTEYLFKKQNVRNYQDDLDFEKFRLERPFKRKEGHAWIVDLPALADCADCMDSPRRSTLVVVEDGSRLFWGHAMHDDIGKLGFGRYSHWGESLVFSTSDNTDPNHNGREYTLRLERAIEVTPKVREVLARPFIHDSGYCWRVDLPAFTTAADNSDFARRSKMLLYENGSRLLLAHSLHDDIRNLGKGRYSHWENSLRFSATDNSDPNQNGREYSVSVDNVRG